MSDYHETLEDLLCYLESARDSLIAIHCAIEAETMTEQITLNALFAVHSHLDFIAKAMGRHIAHIPCEVLRKAAKESAA